MSVDLIGFQPASFRPQRCRSLTFKVINSNASASAIETRQKVRLVMRPALKCLTYRGIYEPEEHKTNGNEKYEKETRVC